MDAKTSFKDMAATTPRRSSRLPHTHTPKLSDRKKGLFQSDSEPRPESLTKHRKLPVVDSESDSEECDLGIICTLDSSSDENDHNTPKTPERTLWRSVMSAPHRYHIKSFRGPPPENRELVLMLHNNVYVFTSTVGTQTDPETFYVNGKPARAVQPFRVVRKPVKTHATQAVQADMEQFETGPPTDVQQVRRQLQDLQEIGMERPEELQQQELEWAQEQPRQDVQNAEWAQPERQSGLEESGWEQPEEEEPQVQQEQEWVPLEQNSAQQPSELQQPVPEQEPELHQPEVQQPGQQETELQAAFAPGWQDRQHLQTQETQTELQHLHRQMRLLNDEENAAAPGPAAAGEE